MSSKNISSEELVALERELAEVLNRHSVDAMANMTDFLLARYVVTCIAALKTANERKSSQENNQ